MFEFKDSDDYKDQFGIYEIRNLKTGCVYIGQTRQAFKKRFFYHRWQLRTNKHENPYLQMSFNKHGEDCFLFSVRKVIANTEDLDEAEIQEIIKAKKEGRVYNMLSGGGGRPGIPLSEERKKQLGELNKVLNTGKKASSEIRQKMSKARKGKKRNKEDMDKTVATRTNNIVSGSKYKTQKITFDQAIEIKKALMANVSYDDLAATYQITYSNINAIRSNRSWKYAYVEGWDDYCKTNKHNTRARQSRSAN